MGVSPKLSEAEQADVRRLWASGNYSQVRLAEMYDVSQPTISRVVAGVQRPEGAKTARRRFR